MPKSRKNPAIQPPDKEYPSIVADKQTVARAILELHINVPVYHARVVGDRIELRLYGGKVAYWPPAEALGPPGPENPEHPSPNPPPAEEE
jgi:hypothetical protein